MKAAGAWAQMWVAVARTESARAAGAFACAPRSTHLGSAAGPGVGDIFRSRAAYKLQHPCKTSGWTPVYGLRGGSIRKKVIGHGMRAIVTRLSLGKHVGQPRRSFSLLNQQARQHGCGVLVDPLVNQGGDLLAEIGGVRQTRQFKTLQGVPRSRKQELPRWLGRAGSHRPPMGTRRTVTER